MDPHLVITYNLHRVPGWQASKIKDLYLRTDFK